MDEDSDLDKELDNSLGDLRYGLDSSVDESASGVDKDEFQAPQRSHSENTLNEGEMADDQMNMLQDMVLEMKQGFQSALEELAKIQDKEEGDSNHSKRMQQQQQRQLDDLTESIHEIKNQLASLTKNMEEIKVEQQTLKNNLEEVRSTRGSSQDSKVHSDGDRPDLLDDFSTTPEEWNTKLSELPSLAEDHPTDSSAKEGDNDITAAACKSLSLTQALGEKCLNLNLSQSSDDEERVEERRISHYTPKTSQLVLDEAGHRRFSLPASATPQGRNKDINSAAKRQEAVKELADSERDYCSQLWSLLHTYLTPLQTAGFLSARELGVLFPPYLDQLYGEHCQICSGLQDRLIHWTYMGTIADLLAKVTDSYSPDSLLSLYKEYGEDLPNAVTCLKRAMGQSSEFRSFLKAIKHSTCQSEDLMSLIMAPMQHIPKFLLQLQEVARHTPPTHPDYPLLHTALHRLRGFVDQLNEEVTNTIQALTQNPQLGSDGDGGPPLSARDSGVHSNSTEDDGITSARAFSKAERGHIPPEWIEDSYYSSHNSHSTENILGHWQLRPSSAKFSALSQPDLTVYKNLNSLSSDPHSVSNIPRSQSALPANANGEDIAAGRQHRKYKIKKRIQSPVGYTGQAHDHFHHSLSPRGRPSSAIDFLSHSYHQQQQQQQQYQHHFYRDQVPQPRGFQYPGPQPRPHSALGPQVIDRQHKPMIISRKHLRRSQPPMPTSSSYWAEAASSGSVHSRVGHLRGHLSTHDLLPTRPSPYHNPDLMDDEEEEDDTRASDTHSLGTSGSHPHSSSHCSNEGHDADLDLYQSHLESPRNPDLTPDTSYSTEFSSAEVAASLARKLVTDQSNTMDVEPDCKMGSSNSIPSLRFKQELSSSGSRICEDGEKASDKSINSLATTGEIHSESSGKENGNNTVLMSENFPMQQSAKTVSPEKQNTVQEKSDSLSPFKSNMTRTVSNSTKSVGSVDEDNKESENESFSKVNESRNVSENNRQFLLSLTSKPSSSIPARKDYSPSKHHNVENHNTNGNTLPKQNSNPLIKSPDLSSSNYELDTGHNLPQAPLRNGKGGSSAAGVLPAVNGSRGLNNSDSIQSFSKLSHPIPIDQHESPQEEKNKRLSLGSRSTTAVSPPQRFQKNRHQVLSAGYLHQGLPPGQEPHGHSKTTSSSLESSQPHSKLKPLLLSSSIGASSKHVVQQPLETAIDTPREEGDDFEESNSYPDSCDLPPLEVADWTLDDGRKRDGKKKQKDGGKAVVSDGLPKTSDDPVGARKKMHFKASIKNLFTKKKGRVILADVEREVVMQMVTEAAAATTTTTSTKSATAPSPKVACSRIKKDGNLPGTVSHDVHDKTIEESAFEIKTRKDQGNSTSSPVKVSKMFHFHPRPSDKQPRNDRAGREMSNAEFEQHQQYQSTIEQLKAHNKRHGLVLENPDTQFEHLADVDNCKQVGSKKQSTVFHSKEETHQKQFQQKNGQNKDKSSEHVWNKSFLNFCKRKGPKQTQHQPDHKEIREQKRPPITICDTSKVSADSSNGKKKCKNENGDQSGKGKVEQLLISKSDRNRSERLQSQQRIGPSQRISQANTHHLCQQCQNCELNKKEKFLFANKLKIDETNSNQAAVKVCDSWVGFGKLGSSEAGLKYPVNISASSMAVPVSEDKNVNSSTIDRNVHQNDLNDDKRNKFLNEKVLHFPNTTSPVDFSVSECLKPCADAIHLYETNKKKTMTSSYPLTNKDVKRRREQSDGKQKHCVLSPVSEERHPLQLHLSPSPDKQVMKTQSHLKGKTPHYQMESNVPLQGQLQNSGNIMRIASNETDRVNQEKKRFRISSKAFEVKGPTDNSLNKHEMIPRESASHDHKPICTETVKVDKPSSSISEPSVPEEEVTSELYQSRDCNEPHLENAENDHLTKPYDSEDKHYFEHKYRLYYDDEMACYSKQNMSENAKDGGAKSRLLVKGMTDHTMTVTSYNDHELHKYQRGSERMRLNEPFNTQANELHTVEQSKNDAVNPHVEMPSTSASRDHRMKTCSPDEEALTFSSSVAHPAALVNTPYSLKKDHTFLNTSSSQTLSQLSSGKDTGLIVASNLNHTSGNANESSVAPGKINAVSSVGNKNLSSKALSFLQLVEQNKNGSISKKCSQQNVVNNDDCSLGAVGGEMVNSEEAAHPVTNGILYPTDDIVYNESCSYKPKYPQPVLRTHLANANTSRLTRDEQTEETMLKEVATKQVSPKSPLSLSSNPVTPVLLSSEIQNELRLQEPECSNYPLLAPQAVSSSRQHSQKRDEHQLQGRDRYNPDHRFLHSESNSCKTQSANPFSDGTDGFFRTSSPQDIFSVLPYRDYVLCTVNSDSSTVVPSDADSHSTPTSIKSSSTGKPEEQCKRRKDLKKGLGYNGSYLNCVSERPCIVHSTEYEPRRNIPRNMKRQRHNDGVILKAHDKDYYPLHFPRYSMESGSLISSAFLQKMSYLPQYPSRPVSHPQADQLRCHLGSKSARQATVHAELLKNPRNSNTEEPGVQLKQVSRNLKGVSTVQTTGASACRLSSNQAIAEMPQNMSFDESQSTAGTSISHQGNIQVSPDLLPVNDCVKEKSSASKKAQSFFSRLTHSPMSFFNKDSKSTNPPK